MVFERDMFDPWCKYYLEDAVVTDIEIEKIIFF